MVNCPKDELKINSEAIKICLIQHFEADFLYCSVESQPQNPEFKNNPENFHHCLHQLKWYYAFRKNPIGMCILGYKHATSFIWKITLDLDSSFHSIPKKTKFSNCFEREDHIYIKAKSLNKTRHIYIFGEVLKGSIANLIW